MSRVHNQTAGEGGGPECWARSLDLPAQPGGPRGSGLWPGRRSGQLRPGQTPWAGRTEHHILLGSLNPERSQGGLGRGAGSRTHLHRLAGAGRLMDSQRVPLTPSAHNGGWRSVCAQEKSGCNMRGKRQVGAWAPPSPGVPGPTKPHSPGQTLMAERSKGGGAHAERPPESGTKCPQGQRDVPSQGSKLTPAPLPWRALEEPHPRGHIRQPLPT